MGGDPQGPLPRDTAMRPARHRFFAEFLELFSVRPLARECHALLLANPYYWRIFVFNRDRLVRRIVFAMLIALAVFTASTVLVAAFGGVSPAVWTMGYLFVRAALIFRTASVTASLVRSHIRDGWLHELSLSSVSPMEVASGWAMEAWVRTIPESLIVFAALYPWGANVGGLAALIPLSGIIALFMYQGIAALATSRVALDYNQRREAVAAGWIIATIILPMFLWLLVSSLGLLLLVPLVLVYQAADMVGELVKPGLDLSRWIDIHLADAAEIMANIYFIAGNFVVYLVFLFCSLCIRFLGQDEPPPQIEGYFEHGIK